VAAARCQAVPGGRVALVHAELDATPIADASVDLVVLRFVLQHLPDPRTALDEVRRILRPGGRVMAIDVDGSLWGIADPPDPVLAELQGRRWSGRSPEGGHRADRLIGRRLGRLLRTAGFEATETRLYSYDSDEVGIDALRPLLDPVQLMPLVEDGIVSPAELAAAVHRFRGWCARPDAYALLVGFAATGVAPGAGQAI
jgi:SAM-dependent methyltransferase